MFCLTDQILRHDGWVCRLIGDDQYLRRAREEVDADAPDEAEARADAA